MQVIPYPGGGRFGPLQLDAPPADLATVAYNAQDVDRVGVARYNTGPGAIDKLRAKGLVITTQRVSPPPTWCTPSRPVRRPQ